MELKAVEAELAKELNEMNEEYDVAMQAKNRAFEKLKGAKDERRSRNADFGENRDFSRRVCCRFDLQILPVSCTSFSTLCLKNLGLRFAF